MSATTTDAERAGLIARSRSVGPSALEAIDGTPILDLKAVMEESKDE